MDGRHFELWLLNRAHTRTPIRIISMLKFEFGAQLLFYCLSVCHCMTLELLLENLMLLMQPILHMAMHISVTEYFDDIYTLSESSELCTNAFFDTFKSVCSHYTSRFVLIKHKKINQRCPQARCNTVHISIKIYGVKTRLKKQDKHPEEPAVQGNSWP